MNTQEKQKFLQEYAESLKGKSLDELKKIEQEVIAEAEAVDAEVNAKEFALPEEGYGELSVNIRSLLDKQTVQWQYTPALVAMYEFWDPKKKPETVPYAMLDSTLRNLGQLSFTGYGEAKAVVNINAYFEPIREDYANTTEKIYDVASKHNTVMDAMNLQKPIGTVGPGGELSAEQ